MASSPVALVIHIVANLLPLVGVLYFDWGLLAVVMLYWAETGVFFTFETLKVAVRPSENGFVRRLLKVFAALLGTGIFWVVYGPLLFWLLEPTSTYSYTGFELMSMLSLAPSYALLGFVVSHGLSFAFSFANEGAADQSRGDSAATRRSNRDHVLRVLVVHIATAFFGGLFVQHVELGEPTNALLALVGFNFALGTFIYTKNYVASRPSAAGADDREQRNQYVVRLEAPVPDSEIDAITKKVALAAKMPEDRARKIVSRPSGNLSRPTTKETAERYAGYLRGAGMDVVAIRDAMSDEAPDAASTSEPTRTTPDADETLEAPRQGVSPLALAFLVGANVLPLVGVLFFDWSLFAVIFLYWAENGVIGFFNVFKMFSVGSAHWLDNVRAKPGAIDEAMVDVSEPRLSLISAFSQRYGLFWLIHGAFVVAFFGVDENDVLIVEEVFSSGLLIGLLSLIVSHGMSFWFNYIGDSEYRRTSYGTLQFQPYIRVFILHCTIIFGGMAAQELGQPIWALVLLIALKIFVDMAAHLYEHTETATAEADGAEV